MNSIDIKLFSSPQEAPVYREPEYKGASLTSAVIVRNGTEQGKPTVDLVFVDETGQKYVTLVTAALLDAVRTIVSGCQTETMN